MKLRRSGIQPRINGPLRLSRKLFLGRGGAGVVGAAMLMGTFAPLAASPAGAQPTTLYVEPGATGTTCSDSSPADACPTITAALAVASSGDTIDLGSGTIADNVVISADLTGLSVVGSATGGSTTVSGGGGGPVIWIQGGASVTISDLTITDGTASAPSTYSGGIYNQGAATLEDDTVSGNSDSGIGNYGSLQISDSTVSGNYGTGFGNYADATVTNSTFSGNTADPPTPPGGVGNGGAISERRRPDATQRHDRIELGRELRWRDLQLQLPRHGRHHRGGE